MSRYSDVDLAINGWVERHQLVLFTSSDGIECRAVFLSSAASETFQIWIEAPARGAVGIHVAYIDGIEAREPEPRLDWIIPLNSIEAGLEIAMSAVLGLMAPSERYFSARAGEDS